MVSRIEVVAICPHLPYSNSYNKITVIPPYSPMIILGPLWHETKKAVCLKLHASRGDFISFALSINVLEEPAQYHNRNTRKCRILDVEEFSEKSCRRVLMVNWTSPVC